MRDSVDKRAYVSPVRQAAAAATRDRICSAAEHLFMDQGYARTSIRAVAGAAGVAEATVYLAFSTKAELLDATILRAIAEAGTTSLEDLAAGPPDQILPAVAEATSRIMQRAARLIAIGESAALIDAAMVPLRERAYRRLRAGMGRLTDRLAAARLLRPGLTPQAAADSLYAIASATTFLRLVEDCGYPPERYADWLRNTATAVLLGADRHAS